jgi:hypothetical protein
MGKHNYNNGIYFSVESGISNIDDLPFAVGENLWIIMADGFYLYDYEESATEYGVTSDGRWVALSDGHCSCYGWEASEGDCTYYKNLLELLKCDNNAKVILKHKDILIQVYPFLKKYFTKKVLAC